MDNFLKLRFERSKTIRIRSEISSSDKKSERVINLILDTGADKTSLTSSILKDLGYTQFLPQSKKILTAKGLSDISSVRISQLVIGNQFRLSDMEIDVLDFDSTQTFDGVIGMDFISQVETHISGKDKTLTITA